MNLTENITGKSQAEIEITQLRMVMEQGAYLFLATLAFSFAVILALWNHISHPLVLLWFVVLNAINFARWLGYRNYLKRLNTAQSINISRIKLILLIDGFIYGLGLGIGNFLLLDPAQPYTLLIMSIAAYFFAINIIFSWFNYLPAIVACNIPLGGSLLVPLYLQGGSDNVNFILVVSVSIACGIVVCFKIREIYSSALFHSYENITLRKKSDQARAAAEQANSAKTRFLSAASHDLRQPIHALNLLFAELSSRIQGPETDKLISQLNDAISTINTMLNALLDVSKLDAGVMHPNIEYFKLMPLLRRLESEFLPIALENNNILRIWPTKVTVCSDSVMLESILRNLISNALRYTENGRVLIRIRRRDDYAQIQVFDNGSGIPENQLDKIFIEFHQLVQPKKNRQQGLGLGLSIVKRLVNLLNHDIKVHSELGRGSCFSITLPLAPIECEPICEKASELSNVCFPSKYSILVIDDDKLILEGMRGLLTYWGYQTIMAFSSQEAFRLINENQGRPNLLIIDYRLGGNESGIEVAKKIHQYFSYALPTILLTGDTSPERLQEAITSGYQLLHKPVKTSDLHFIIQALISTEN